MTKKRPNDGEQPLSAEARAKLNRSLLAKSGCTKSGIARMLLVLEAAGALAEGVLDAATADHIRRDVGRAAKTMAKANTPFGPVIQEIVLPTTPAFKWEVIQPQALVFMLSMVSPAFAAGMIESIEKHSKQQIVIYIDECTPGNILRPDQGRAVNNIFWAFSTWPEYMLQRDWCWMTFGCIRSRTLETLPGKMTALAKFIIHSFFSPTSHNFATCGGMVQCRPGENRVFLADFAG